MPDTSVKFFHSEMQGAPALSGSAGALIAVLDGCLVNGFGLKTLTSLVVADNVATMNFTGGHPFEVDTVALVAGATPSGLNGSWKISATTANSASFATSGISNQTATGTISAKLAAAGWTKTYSGTNKAAYKSNDPQSTGDFLRVDDAQADARSARVVGYETMSDIDTGAGAFPTSVQVAGGLHWNKSAESNSNAKKWLLFADSRTLYLAVETQVGYLGSYQTVGFGDAAPTKSNDAFCCFVSGTPTQDYNLQVSSHNIHYSNGTGVAQMYMARSYTGIGSAVQLLRTYPSLAGESAYQSGGANLAYPNPADGGLYISEMRLTEAATQALRGVGVGIYACPQNVPNGQFSAKDRVTGVTGLVGRTLYAVTGYKAASQYSAPFFFDVTGPWR
jgi:hypothetical protein